MPFKTAIQKRHAQYLEAELKDLTPSKQLQMADGKMRFCNLPVNGRNLNLPQ